MNLRYFKGYLTQIKQEISVSSHINNNPVVFVCALKKGTLSSEDQDFGIVKKKPVEYCLSYALINVSP